MWYVIGFGLVVACGKLLYSVFFFFISVFVFYTEIWGGFCCMFSHNFIMCLVSTYAQKVNQPQMSVICILQSAPANDTFLKIWNKMKRKKNKNNVTLEPEHFATYTQINVSRCEWRPRRLQPISMFRFVFCF